MKLYVTFIENQRLGQVIRVFSTQGQAQDFCKKFMAAPGYFLESDGTKTGKTCGNSGEADGGGQGDTGYVWYRKYTEEDLDSLLIQEVILSQVPSPKGDGLFKDDSGGVGILPMLKPQGALWARKTRVDKQPGLATVSRGRLKSTERAVRGGTNRYAGDAALVPSRYARQSRRVVHTGFAGFLACGNKKPALTIVQLNLGGCAFLCPLKGTVSCAQIDDDSIGVGLK